MTSTRDRGSATVVLCGAIAIALSSAAVIAEAGQSMANRALAQAVADAAALAGALGSRPDAERIAQSNGAALVSFDRSIDLPRGGSTVRAVIALDGSMAVSWASDAS